MLREPKYGWCKQCQATLSDCGVESVTSIVRLSYRGRMHVAPWIGARETRCGRRIPNAKVVVYYERRNGQ